LEAISEIQQLATLIEVTEVEETLYCSKVLPRLAIERVQVDAAVE
jgi:hypothetical protein